MKKLLLLIKKNLRLLIRSKGSALIVIFAPLLIILLIGLSYNTSDQYGLNIGVHSTSFAGDVQTFMDSLQAQDFKVVTYNNVDDCLEDIKYNFVHACVSVPASFQVEDNSAKEVTFYLDQSKINLVSTIQQALEEEFSLRSAEISENIINNIFDKINTAQNDIGTQKSSLSTLTTTTSSLSSQASQIQSQLNSISLSAVSYSVNYTVLDSFETEVTTSIDDAIEILAEVLNQASKVENISDSDLEDISNVLDDAKAQLVETKDLFSVTTNSSNSTNSSSAYDDVEKVISQLEETLDGANSQLSTAASQVSSIGISSSTLSSSISGITSSISQIQSRLETIKSSLANFAVSDTGTIASPLVVNVEKITAEKTKLNYVYSSLLALIVMFLSIMLGNTLVMMEKSSQAYIRNFLIPAKKIVFVFSTVLTNLILVAIQLVIILLISLIFLPQALVTLPTIFLICLFSAAVFTLVGMGIGYVFTSEETGILASISTGSLFLFLSGTILPVEGMSVSLREFTQLNPFVITEKLIREVFIFSSGLGVILEDLAILLIYAAILFMLIMVIDSFVSRHLLRNMMFRSRKKRKNSHKVKGAAKKVTSAVKRKWRRP